MRQVLYSQIIAGRRTRYKMKTHYHGAGYIDRLAYTSGMNAWNPSLKAIISLSMLILSLWESVGAILVIIISAIIQKIYGKLPFREYGRLLTVPLGFLLLSCTAVACDISTAPIGDWFISLRWFYIGTSATRIYSALLLLFRALGAVSALYFLTLTTTVGEWIRLLRRIRCPALLCELMYLIYRFIFVLSESQERMRTAAATRLGWRDFPTSCRSFGGIAGNLLVTALRHSRTYYDAMAARGYDEEIAFLEEEKPIQRKQVAATIIILGALYGVSIVCHIGGI